MEAFESREAARRRRLKRQVAHERRVVALEGRPETTENRGLLSTPAQEAGRARRELVALAWPIAAAMLGETAIGLVDTKLVSGLGAGALGGVGLATTLMFLGYSFVLGAMRSVKVRTAHAVGEGRARDGLVYARAGAVLGFAFGLVVLLATRDVSGLLRAIGTDPAIIPYARDFLAAFTLGAPQTCALAALIQHRQGAGDTRSTMVVGIAGNIFNALFAWGLIYGHFGLPALGVRGAGFATATTETLELAAMAFLLVREGRVGAGVSLRQALREITELGLPTGIQFAFEMLAFTAFTVVLGAMGSAEIAAHQIALNVIRVSFLPGVAVSEAASVMVGRALGRRSVHSLREADATVRSALGIAVIFMALWGVIFAAAGGLIAAFFARDPTVASVARKLLLVAAGFQILDAVNIVLRGALRGAKDVRMAALIGIATIWLFIPTAAWFLGRQAGLGALGGWIGFVCETSVGAALCWLRWSRGSWRKVYLTGP